MSEELDRLFEEWWNGKPFGNITRGQYYETLFDEHVKEWVKLTVQGAFEAGYFARNKPK